LKKFKLEGSSQENQNIAYRMQIFTRSH